MIFRYLLWAALMTALLGYVWATLPRSAGELVEGPFWGILLGLCGALLAGRAGDEWRAGWQQFWLSLVAGVWLAATLTEGWKLFAMVEGWGPQTLRLLLPYALSTSLFLGCLALLARNQASPELLPLTLLMPGIVAVLVWANPAGRSLAWLPLLAASGLLPSDRSTGAAREPVWRSGPAAFVEMLSLQCVAWGAGLSGLFFLAELASSGLLNALFVGSATGCFAWLSSGLLWGVSDHLRRGRLALGPVVRLLFGKSVAPDSVTPVTEKKAGP